VPRRIRQRFDSTRANVSIFRRRCRRFREVEEIRDDDGDDDDDDDARLAATSARPRMGFWFFGPFSWNWGGGGGERPRGRVVVFGAVLTLPLAAWNVWQWSNHGRTRRFPPSASSPPSPPREVEK
jgi:hypothetical protein